MQRGEIRDSGALVGTSLGEVAELAQGVHRAVAARIFGALGPVGRPVQLVHDAIATTAYTSSRVGARVLPTAAGLIAANTATPSTQAYADTPRGHFVLSALNGFWGDRIADRHTALAPALALRTHAGVLRRTPGNVAHDEANPTGRLVIFLHGLCENERFFWFGAERNFGDAGTTYGSLLRDERGWTPLYAHYNTGLHVSDNGTLLADYLQALVARWPVPVTEIALVGHSMGGLVARSAAHVGAERDLEWTRVLRHVVGLGTPHLGAPLERWVNAGTHALSRLPETRPFATWLNRRSAGIKDLRFGAVLEGDWLGHDPDERLVDHCAPATLSPQVAYSMVSATLSTDPDGRLAHDLLVEHVSAHGSGRPDAARRIDFEIDRLLHVGGRTHFHLLADREVYATLRSWLDGTDGAAAPESRPA